MLARHHSKRWVVKGWESEDGLRAVLTFLYDAFFFADQYDLTSCYVSNPTRKCDMEQFFKKKEVTSQVTQLSMEEEAILISELQDEQVETQSAFDDITRVNDIEQGVSDVREIVASMDNQGEIEQQLADAVADMAVVGTDADPIELFTVPSSDEIATEGFSEKALAALKAFWEAIKVAIAKAKEIVKKFFHNLHVFISPTQRRLERIKKEQEEKKARDEARAEEERKELDRIREHVRRTQFEYPGKFSRLVKNNGLSRDLPKDLSELTKWGERMLFDITAGLVVMADKLEKSTGKAAADLDKFNINDFAEEYFVSLRHDLLEYAHIPYSNFGENDRRDNQRLGGVATYCRLNAESMPNKTAEEKIYSLTNLFQLFISCADQTLYGKRKVSVLSQKEKDNICAISKEWATFLEKHNKDFYTDSLSRHIENIQKNVDNVYQRNSASYHIIDNHQQVRALMDVSRGFIQNVTQCQASLIQRINDVVNACLDYVLTSDAHEAKIEAEDLAAGKE